MIRTPNFDGKYTNLWQKYRPMLLKLMVDAHESPQSYQFQKHEFSDLNGQKPSGYSFKMEVFKNEKKNKVVSNVATDLLNTLQSSPKSEELTSENAYLFKLNNKFTLEVSRIDQ
ncbi:MAG: hypothetical protein AAGA66_12120 [Bacteroidota bacterium]